MKKLVVLAAAGFLAVAPFVTAQAEDHEAHGSVAVEAAAEAETPAVGGPAQLKLQDGTNIVMDGNSVSVVGADGSLSPAPDGTHTLEDGSKVTTAGGTVVESAVEAPAAE